MKKRLTTEQVLAAYRVLAQAKVTKVADDEKIKVVKAVRALKPVATAFEDAVEDAGRQLKPDGYDERLRQAQEYEQKKDGGAQMGQADYEAFIVELKQYRELQGKAVRELAEKVVEVEMDALGEDAVSRLLASNDWTVGQASAVMEALEC